MESISCLEQIPTFWVWSLPILVIWDAIWKLAGLWRSARRGHFIWFLCIAILNTVGVLPIIYLLTHKKQ